LSRNFSAKEIEDLFGGLLQWGINGGFIESFMLTYQKADFGNKTLLEPVALELIEKYKLNNQWATLKRQNLHAKRASEEFLHGRGINKTT